MDQSDLDRFRATNARIVDLAGNQLDDFWASLDLTKPEVCRNEIIAFLTDLIGSQGDVAAVVAADWYEDLREQAGVSGRFVPSLAATVSADRIESTVRFGAQHLFTDHPEQTLAFLANKTSKYVLQPGRDTIAAAAYRDPAASGWKRVARPGSCKFCRMLEGRGGVYKEATAHFASHGDCHCAAVPSWDRHAPEVDARAYVASRRTSQMTPEQRARHTARVQDFLTRMA